MDRIFRPENDTDYVGLPERYREGMKRYIEDRILPGKFLQGMLQGDIRALAWVDLDMVCELRNIYLWIYNEVPSPAWGSPEKVKEWVEGRTR